MNAALAAEFGVSVVLVSGDDQACADADTYAPGGVQGRRQTGGLAWSKQQCRALHGSHRQTAIRAQLAPSINDVDGATNRFSPRHGASRRDTDDCYVLSSYSEDLGAGLVIAFEQFEQLTGDEAGDEALEAPSGPIVGLFGGLVEDEQDLDVGELGQTE
jgi:hypothetical protein